MNILGKTTLAVFFATAFVFSLAQCVVKAHDHWISDRKITDPITGAWCCDEKDCHPQPAGSIVERPDGFLIKATGEIFPKERVIWKSQDGEWWRCENAIRGPQGQVTTRCLIGPPPGS